MEQHSQNEGVTGSCRFDGYAHEQAWVHDVGCIVKTPLFRIQSDPNMTTTGSDVEIVSVIGIYVSLTTP